VNTRPCPHLLIAKKNAQIKIFKIKEQSGRVAQVVEHLPSKCDPKSNPNTAKKEN
jgi:hypothetical protein